MADLFELSASLFLDTKPFENSANSADGLLDKIGKKLFNISGQHFKVALDVATNFVGDVFEHGMEFEEATGAVFALTQETNKYKKELFETTALTEAAESTFTGAEVAAAGMYEALAGFNQDEVTAGLHGLIVTAEAAGEPLKGVSDILTDMVTAYGDGASEMMHYGDVLAATATNTNTTILKLGQALKYIAPVAASLGSNIEETSFFVGILSDNAIKGSQAGTTLRNVFTRIATNAGQTNKDLGALDILVNKLGVSFYDAEGNARPLKTVIDEMRAAWAGLDEVSRKNIADEFNAAVGSTKEAEATLRDFAKDAEKIKELNKSLNNTKDDEAREKYADQIGQIGKQYDELLKLLGIPIPETMSGYANAIDKARTKLGLMSDQDKIYYAKQIGSMRGMSGVLAILNYDLDKYNEKWEAINNSDGAAEKMRQMRLDNLQGDVKKLDAAYDTLLDTIYLDIREPLRPLVQWATDAIQEISEAISENGLLGGVEKLGEKIREGGEKLAPMLESIGAALGPVVAGLINTVRSDLEPAAIALGSSFASGLLQGFSSSSNSLLLSVVSGLLGDAAGGAASVGQKGGIWGMLSGAITNLMTGGIGQGLNPSVKLQTFEVDNEKLKETLQSSTRENPPSIYVIPMVDPDLDVLGDGDAYGYGREKYKVALAEAGDEGGADAAANLTAHMDEASAAVGSMVATDLNNAGVDGGADAAAGYYGAMDTASAEVAGIVASDIGNSGTQAGNDMAGGIQDALNGWIFKIPIVGTIASIVTGNIHHNAVAMNTGRIYRKPTVFGYADGAFQEAGDAGAEAVVGVNSLQSMIAGAVNSAMGDFIERLDDLISGMPDISDMGMYIDGDVLVGRISRRMNAELNKIATWRGSGRS